MHVPTKWQLTDPKQVNSLINKIGFAALVTQDLNASHLPLMLNEQTQSLTGHFARSNNHSKFTDGTQAVAIFEGPHHYISPNWYKNKPAVPTWNYVAIHVHGKLFKQTSEQTLTDLNQLINKYQPELLKTNDVLTEEYKQKLSKGILGFRLVIDNIEAKAKLGQHKSIDDQQGVVEGLAGQKSARELIEVMEYLGLGQS